MDRDEYNYSLDDDLLVDPSYVSHTRTHLPPLNPTPTVSPQPFSIHQPQYSYATHNDARAPTHHHAFYETDFPSAGNDSPIPGIAGAVNMTPMSAMNIQQHSYEQSHYTGQLHGHQRYHHQHDDADIHHDKAMDVGEMNFDPFYQNPAMAYAPQYHMSTIGTGIPSPTPPALPLPSYDYSLGTISPTQSPFPKFATSSAPNTQQQQRAAIRSSPFHSGGSSGSIRALRAIPDPIPPTITLAQHHAAVNGSSLPSESHLTRMALTSNPMHSLHASEPAAPFNVGVNTAQSFVSPGRPRKLLTSSHSTPSLTQLTSSRGKGRAARARAVASSSQSAINFARRCIDECGHRHKQ